MTRPRWPKIPRTVPGIGGPIRVQLVKRAMVEGTLCWGTWHAETRTIQLDRTAKPEHRWRTLYHELTHSALDDSGLSYLFSEHGNESLCEAMASARMAELRDAIT